MEARTRVVDMHNHIAAPQVVEFLEREGKHFDTEIVERDGARFFRIGSTATRPIHDRICQAEARLPDMDAVGIDVQAVSCIPFLMYPEVDPALGREIATVNNGALAEIAESLPERFAPLASVPLQDPEAAAAELERAVALGLRGAQIPPRVGSHWLDEERFEPFWAAAEALDCVLCMHPFDANPEGPFARYGLGNLVGNLYDTGLSASLLVYGGVLERYPGLRIVLYHGGGTLPCLLGRLDRGHAVMPANREALPRSPSSYAGAFHFDTITFDRGMLAHLVSRFGAERVVIGSDYPLPMGPEDPVAEVRALGLTSEDEAAVLGGNALDLLSPGHRRS